jgi:drug/metabolite transporter (DMT)-like permease
VQLHIALLVLLAAAIHAGWNAFVKVSANSLLTLAAIILTCSAISLAGTAFVGFPEPVAWPYLAVSALFRNLYYVVLIVAYRFGDLSYVYPLMRGTTPFTVAVLAFLLADERPGPGGIAGLALITLGILVLTFFGQSWRSLTFTRIAPSLIAGLLVAGFTVVDGMGVRAVARPWDFIVWLLVLSGVPVALYVLGFQRRQIGPFLAAHWRTALASGALSTLGLWIILYALQHGAMAEIAALRETSIVFAALIGALRLKEPLGTHRVGASLIVLLGIVTLQIPR